MWIGILGIYMDRYIYIQPKYLMMSISLEGRIGLLVVLLIGGGFCAFSLYITLVYFISFNLYLYEKKY